MRAERDEKERRLGEEAIGRRLEGPALLLVVANKRSSRRSESAAVPSAVGSKIGSEGRGATKSCAGFRARLFLLVYNSSFQPEPDQRSSGIDVVAFDPIASSLLHSEVVVCNKATRS